MTCACGAITFRDQKQSAPGLIKGALEGVIIMTNTAVFILIAIVVVAGIFWLVIYASKRGEKHRLKTSIKPPDSHREGQAG